MKKLLEKLSVWVVAVCSLVLAIGLTACVSQKRADGTVASVDNNTYVIEITAADDGATLKDVMLQMQADGKLAFTDEGGMITNINGYTPDSAAHEFFALYTSCEGYTSASYGTIVIEGTTYESAILGYASLPAVVGEIYIWAIATW